MMITHIGWQPAVAGPSSPDVCHATYWSLNLGAAGAWQSLLAIYVVRVASLTHITIDHDGGQQDMADILFTAPCSYITRSETSLPVTTALASARAR